MAELIGGALLGEAVGKLLDFIIDVAKRTIEFKSILINFQTTLTSLKSTFDGIHKLGFELDLAHEVRQGFKDLLTEIESVVGKCSKVNILKKAKYAKELDELEAKLLKFFQINVQAQLWNSNYLMLKGMKDLERKIDRLGGSGSSGGGSGVPGSGRRGSMPELPNRKIVGLEKPVEELKELLFRDEVSAVVITAMGGSGKTTLATKFCHDDTVKGKFGKSIFFVTVSATPDVQSIVCKLFEDIGEKQQSSFPNDILAIKEWGRKIKDLGIENVLLVLDDVWPKEEFIVENFDFRTPGYKLLVTSRYRFTSFDEYEMKLLSEEDALTLFCDAAFRSNVPTVPIDLVNEVVKRCKASPLALTVVGSSLYRAPLFRWKSTLKKWSEGEPVIGSDRILQVIQTSLDALDELPDHVKQCYLDLGSFSEDERIKPSLLKDLWVDMYDLDEEGIDTLDCLYELSTRNLITFNYLEDVVELDGHLADAHYVQQHDLLRELVIYRSSQDPVEQRTRMIIDIKNNKFPKWWAVEKRECRNARLLSISTDENFSSSWYDLHVPEAQVVMLNLRSSYTLPQFLTKMVQIKTMIIRYATSLRTNLANIEVLNGLSNLRRIVFENVSIHSLPSSVELKNLYKLSLTGCKIGQNSATDWSSIFPNLVELYVCCQEDWIELPPGLCMITSLKKLSIINCFELSLLPEELGKLVNLEVLRLRYSLLLRALPESVGELHSLRVLDITNCLGMMLPRRIGELCSLEYLHMAGCGVRLLSRWILPHSVKELKQLVEVKCTDDMASQWRAYSNDLPGLTINVEHNRPAYMKVTNLKFMENVLGGMQVSKFLEGQFR